MVLRARRGGTGSKYVTLRGGVRRAIPFLLVRSGGCATAVQSLPVDRPWTGSCSQPASSCLPTACLFFPATEGISEMRPPLLVGKPCPANATAACCLAAGHAPDELTASSGAPNSRSGPKVCRLSAGGNRIRTSGTAEDAGLVADLYAHNASRRIPQKGVGSDSRLLAPPCGGSGGLGGGLCVSRSMRRVRLPRRYVSDFADV